MLPPDNFQEDPAPVIAHRTSPTNMGLYLLSAVSARDFGWLDPQRKTPVLFLDRRGLHKTSATTANPSPRFRGAMEIHFARR
jgi:cyclic beta-1,2-glucan synthetase